MNPLGHGVVARILAARDRAASGRSVLVAMTGIEGAGKGQAFQFYDLSFWVDCSFDTALERALGRRQEGLSAEDTLAAYRTIYFPAQDIHIARDAPQSAATAVVNNDPRLAGVAEKAAR